MVSLLLVKLPERENYWQQRERIEPLHIWGGFMGLPLVCREVVCFVFTAAKGTAV